MAGNINLAFDYPLLGVFWTIFFFGLAVLWFMLLFRVVADIFRDHDLDGWGKTGWLLFVILLPFLGVFVYVVVRGRQMSARETAHAQARQRAFDSYVRTTAGTGSSRTGSSQVEQLARLTEMHDKGAISDQEFQDAKTKVLH
ncbi:SHOCT domain-containing protein [Actinacidiphila acididurans]|uniref:SHOCT domain-containing protein n=1 Tax=Actinacidiphila acididurans TaxID=2784346 RepID=A0ABS2U1J4_9ACTN|nr:SHOCT domain-containing protein [Actinacidiphila acididurans]MBM9509474.1 SHOCT domain-containing protein [Actinacidiphila acididurans]